jgi:hypothetical protein
MSNGIEEIEANQVAIINNSIELFRTAPAVLKANQERTQKAIMVGNKILDQWMAAWKIDDEEERLQALAAADTRSNDFMVKCSTALKEEKELRASITQMMDAFKKWFTTAENDIDKTKPGSVADRVQINRDKYVKEAAQIREKKREEAERAAAREKAEIDLRSETEKWIGERLITVLAAKKQSVTNAFNAITLETYEAKESDLKAMVTAIEVPALQNLIGQMDKIPYSAYHDMAEKEAIINAAHAKYTWRVFASQWNTELIEVKNDLISKLPSKLNELKEHKRLADEAQAERDRQRLAEEQRQKQLAEANKKEKAALEEKQRKEREQEQERLAQLRSEQEAAAEEQRKREQGETDRLAREAEEARLLSEQNVDMKAQGDKTMALFNQEAAIAEAPDAPEARQGYDIEILHPAAYVQIFQLWFENEGKNQPVDKIGNTKLDQMKAWAEKHAHKNDVKIESKFLKYEPSYKAVNRKSSK